MTRPTRSSEPSASWPLFLTAHAGLLRSLEARLKQVDLPPLEWYDVLWALERAADGRLRMSALAEQLLLTRFNATRLVDRLADAGLVAREKTREDGRGAYAVLTASGRDLRRRMWPVYRAGINDLFEQHLGSRDHAALQRMLRAVIDGNREADPAES